MKQIVLIKGKDKFVFNYENYSMLIDALGELAAKKGVFDWYDAAVLSYKLAKNTEQEILDISSK